MWGGGGKGVVYSVGWWGGSGRGVVYDVGCGDEEEEE